MAWRGRWRGGVLAVVNSIMTSFTPPCRRPRSPTAGPIADVPRAGRSIGPLPAPLPRRPPLLRVSAAGDLVEMTPCLPLQAVPIGPVPHSIFSLFITLLRRSLRLRILLHSPLVSFCSDARCAAAAVPRRFPRPFPEFPQAGAELPHPVTPFSCRNFFLYIF